MSGIGRVRVLALDGGGMLGLIEAVILTRIEAAAGLPAARLFDLIAGTSTGGLMALGLTAPEAPGGGPKFTARDMIRLYRTKGLEIFGRETRRLLYPLSGPKYSDSGLKRVALETFGRATIGQACTDVMAPAYDLTRRAPVFFKSWECREGEDWYMADVARATAAAPTYLPPATIYSSEGRRIDAWDGGLAANNPAMCGLAEAVKACPKAEVTLISIGAGDSAEALDAKALAGHGLLRLAPKILSTAFDGPMDAVDYQCRQMIREGRYFRLSPRLEKAVDRMDDATPGNLDRVQAAAEAYCDERAGDIQRIAALLTGRPEKEAA